MSGGRQNKWGRVVGGEDKWWEARGAKTEGGREWKAKGDEWGSSGR